MIEPQMGHDISSAPGSRCSAAVAGGNPAFIPSIVDAASAAADLAGSLDISDLYLHAFTSLRSIVTELQAPGYTGPLLARRDVDVV